MNEPSEHGGLAHDVRNTPATYSAMEGRILRKQHFAGGATPSCPRCHTPMDVDTGWRARNLITEISCSVCHRCVMFRPGQTV